MSDVVETAQTFEQWWDSRDETWKETAARRDLAMKGWHNGRPEVITALRAQLATAIKERDDACRLYLEGVMTKRALAAEAESDRLRRALEAATKLADGYGIVLAMISAGADAPQKFAKRMLAEYASEAETVRNFK